VSTIDWPPRRARRGGRGIIFAVVAVLFVAGGTALSYYVDSLWFGSLGFADVFWTTLGVQGTILAVFAGVTFLVLYGSYFVLKPPNFGALAGGTIIVNGQPVRLPLEPVLRTAALVIALVIAVGTGLSMMAEWTTFALFWHGGREAGTPDPIFGRPLSFYFFQLPGYRLIARWTTTVAVLLFGVSVVFAVIAGGARMLSRHNAAGGAPLRRVAAAFALLLLAIAAQVYLARFDRILVDHTVFSGVTYADAHVMITARTVLAGALVLGAAIAAVSAVAYPRIPWIVGAVVPALAVYLVTGVVNWYVTSFVVKPNELARERPFISHSIAFTRQAYSLDRVQQIPFPAETGVEALDPANNQDTLQSVRLWDWRALQDTLRQIQEIRTYYDFPDIDIDRYTINGRVTQTMIAVRELNMERLPESSRNWINEKLIYTHGYGITMNPVNGFTPEGQPALILSNMPVRSTVPGLTVTRPQIYFGELTNTDVYVRTGQREFDYPEGDANSETTYEGTGGIPIGGFFRRLLIAMDRRDLTRLPFSDDVTSESRLLMRRNIRARAAAIAPFLIFDDDPYIVVRDDGRLSWMMDAFTSARTYPYSRHFQLGAEQFNYVRNSVKAVVDAYDGAVTFYVFDDADPIIAAYRRVFPALFRDRAEMPADLLRHVRYPELLLEVQAAVYGLYHMTDPDVFYNREDLWTVASEVVMNAQREQAAQTMEPNFVLMKLPGESALEFVEMLPFTPARRNNMIGWIAGRSDGPHYGKTIVYNFPKTKLVDGPMQIEARIDQNAQLSAQMSLWNQQGSSVRRGNLMVIPTGTALLYVKPIYLQAQRSPMPELRVVVLGVQDRLAYAPTFEAALDALFGRASSTLTAEEYVPRQSAAAPAAAGTPDTPAQPAAPDNVDGLISGAARDLQEYQRLTAEGRLGEAGQRLEALKQKLDRLQQAR
jgi:uncharacterized membrane protein (UPF0182 family)